MNTDPYSNVRKRDDDIPEDGDWSALEAKARKELKANKESIERKKYHADPVWGDRD